MKELIRNRLRAYGTWAGQLAAEEDVGTVRYETYLALSDSLHTYAGDLSRFAWDMVLVLGGTALSVYALARWLL